jgi:hypothetical protein
MPDAAAASIGRHAGGGSAWTTDRAETHGSGRDPCDQPQKRVVGLVAGQGRRGDQCPVARRRQFDPQPAADALRPKHNAAPQVKQSLVAVFDLQHDRPRRLALRAGLRRPAGPAADSHVGALRRNDRP